MQTDKKKTECEKKNTDEMCLAEHADAFQTAVHTAAALVPDPVSGTMSEVLGLAASAMETYQNLD